MIDAKDLAEHLAYHASVGYAECRGIEPRMEVTIHEDLVRDHPTFSFAVFHEGFTYRVSVERIS